MSRIVTKDSRLCSFQYKIVNNTLYLNKKLFIFGNSKTLLCPFCKRDEETTLHLFYHCTATRSLWNQTKTYFGEDFGLPILTPQTAIFGFSDKNDFIIKNHILLIFKLFVYNLRKSGCLIFNSFISNVAKN